MTQFCVTILNNGIILENGMHGGHVAGSYLLKVKTAEINELDI